MDKHAHKEKNCCDGDTKQQPAPPEIESLAGERVSTTFRVAGMDCADEIKAIQQALSQSHIFSVQANLMASTVRVSHASELPVEYIKKLIETTGVKVSKPDTHEIAVDSLRIGLVAASGVFAAVGFLLEYSGSRTALTAAACILSVLAGGRLIFPKAWRALRQMSLDMNVLMTVAVVGALVIRQWSEAATVVFLFSLSELLEAFSVARARKAIGEVLNLTPQMATKVTADGGPVATRTEDLQKADLILVKSGERIPVDGIVQKGISFVNQAPLTGESVAVEKKIGDKAFAGTINESGVLEIVVETTFENSKLSQVIRMVEQAQEQKAPSERFVDAFAKIYTPAVFVLAILTLLIPPLLFQGDWGDWFYKALVLLVVACPCALVISTPVSIVSALTALARRGVLVKGGTFLETLGKVRAIALDKTGTITEGAPTVQKVLPFGSSTENDFLQIAASIEKLSSHPLAEAVIEYAEKKGITIVAATGFKNIVGKGAEATIDGHPYFLGNHRLAHELGVCTPELEVLLNGLEEEAFSVIVVGHMPHDGCAGEVIGVLAVGDTVRKEAADAIQELHSVGIQRVIMLSGDNQRTASAIAKQAGIDQALGDLLPEDKVREIKALVQEHGVVAMIGDGINDAPALAQASVGIAMGAAGTDTAIETADVALMRDDLRQVAVAIKQGRRALSIIRFNIAFAISLKLAFLVLTYLGLSNLWIAVGADTGASLLVIVNSLRLLKV